MSAGKIVPVSYTHLDVYKRQEVQCTGRILEVPVGRGLLGRVVNTLGQPIDGKGEIENDGFSPVEVIAPGAVSYTHLDVYKRQTQSKMI